MDQLLILPTSSKEYPIQFSTWSNTTQSQAHCLPPSPGPLPSRGPLPWSTCSGLEAFQAAATLELPAPCPHVEEVRVAEGNICSLAYLQTPSFHSHVGWWIDWVKNFRLKIIFTQRFEDIAVTSSSIWRVVEKSDAILIPDHWHISCFSLNVPGTFYLYIKSSENWWWHILAEVFFLFILLCTEWVLLLYMLRSFSSGKLFYATSLIISFSPSYSSLFTELL